MTQAQVVAANPPATAFSVVDELSCYHDHRAEPNTVHLEVRLAGHLDQAALRAAVTAVLAAVPRARARRAAPGRLARGYRWEFPAAPDDDPVEVAAWHDDAGLTSLRTTFLAATPDLDRAPAFRLLLAVGPGCDCLILSAHHAAFDGQSCLELISRISDNYVHPASAPHQDPVIAGPDCLDLAAPGQAGLPGTAAGQTRTTRRPGSFAVTRIAVTRIAADRTGQPAGDRDGYGCLPLPPVSAAALGAARSRHDVTVNDLLVTALALAIASWNAGHRKPAGQIKITMPVSARPPGGQAELGNLSKLAVVSAGDADLGDTASLLRRISGQTRQAKARAEREVDPVSRALTTSLLPAAVKRAVLRGLLRTAGKLTIDTSLLSNLGVVARPPGFGPVAATAMAFSTSAHLPRGLSAGAITAAGRLQLCLRYRRALLSDHAAAEFAGHFTRALGQVAGC